jgi:proteasome assembly chaperone (PAC2) family protein
MADAASNPAPLMIAAWPGMGNVAVGAAGYLVVKLRAMLIHELHMRDLFEVPHIEVNQGLVQAGRMPRNMFFEWKNPNNGPDLLIFLGEAQPVVGGYGLCHKLLDYAVQKGVSRVFTFAAMASQLHPANKPRVFGVATEASLLQELKTLDVQILKEGQISGLNGVLLAAAAERNISGISLLGELPYFAAAVPNPKASQAVLEIFTKMSAVTIDFTELLEQAKTVEQGLIELLEKLQENARQQGEESFTLPEFAQTAEEEEPEESSEAVAATDAAKKQPAIDYNTRRRIDALFEAAHKDRGRAFHLKQELDRLGVFAQYEDRFLDLFRKAE